MNSMTGFGKAVLKTKVGTFSVEMSSVNNRFLEMQIRQHRQFAALEVRIRELIARHLTRGKLFVFIGFEEPSGAPRKYPINEEAARTYYRRLSALKKELKLSGEIQLRDLLVLPELAAPPSETKDDELVWPSMEKAVLRALRELLAMRRREGTAISRDMKARLKTLNGLTRQIMRASRGVAEKYRDKLNQRLEEMLSEPVPDRLRLEEEVALIAEKADITEECTRLLSHLDQCRRDLDSKGPVGKKLNFILQELNREANTIASKCTEIEISRAAIAVKEEVEKLREQIQNVE